ncbi:hypothetical protein TNCV_3371571 [Trichonephila clavipes]|nr:hypothetical protein TNCV_3371571 [Trichonephila clavipes]
MRTFKMSRQVGSNDLPYVVRFELEVIIPEDQSRPNLEENTCVLRKEKGKCLMLEQRNELDTLLNMFGTAIEPGGEPIPFIEHRINTRDNPFFVRPSPKTLGYKNTSEPSSPFLPQKSNNKNVTRYR